MMFRLVILAICLFCALGEKHGHTKLCEVCNRVRDPSACPLMTCKGEELCFVKVEHIGSEYLFSKGCMHGCHDHDSAIIVGKRASVHEPHGSHDLSVCRKCCLHSPCDGCGHYFGATPTLAPPTTAIPSTTQAPTTTPTPTTTPAIAVSMDATCRDHEGDGFVCADYDAYNFCTNTASGLHKLAFDRCPQHCGFCDGNGNFKVTDMPSPTTPTTTTTGPVITSDIPTSTSSINRDSSELKIDSGCFDSEDADFSCEQWAAYGFCTMGSGTGYSIAVKRCSKYCGFCS